MAFIFLGKWLVSFFVVLDSLHEIFYDLFLIHSARYVIRRMLFELTNVVHNDLRVLAHYF